MTKQAPTRTFTAGLLSLDAKAKTAEFYLMNTSRNRNNWKVTKQALEEAGPTLIGKPIGMGKDYKIDKHYPDGQTMDSGKFVAFEMRGSIAVGKANLTDEQTIALIKAGKLGPVSVVILPYREECAHAAPTSVGQRRHRTLASTRMHQRKAPSQWCLIHFSPSRLRDSATSAGGLTEFRSQRPTRRSPNSS